MNIIKTFNELSTLDAINALAQVYCQEILIRLPASFYTFPNPQYLDKWKHQTQHRNYIEFENLCQASFKLKFDAEFCQINLNNAQQRVYWLGIELAKHKIRETDALEYDPFSREKISDYSLFKTVFPEAAERYDSNFNQILECEERNLHLTDYLIKMLNKDRSQTLASAYPRLFHIYLLKTEPPATETDVANSIRSFLNRSQLSSSTVTKDNLSAIFTSIFNTEYNEKYLHSPRINKLFHLANVRIKEIHAA